MDEKRDLNLVKEGFLSLPSTSYASFFFYKQKTTWSKKWFTLYAKSLQGIQRLEEKAGKGSPQMIIPLNDCLKVASTSSNTFQIITRDGVEYSLRVESEEELNEWVTSVQRLAFADHTMALMTPNRETENEIYSTTSMSNDTEFPVQVLASPSPLLSASGSSSVYFLLKVTPDSIQLLSSSSALIFEWLYPDIRRYGANGDGFSLEAGRKCLSGEGLFSFSTSKGNVVFDQVSSQVNSLKRTRSSSRDANIAAEGPKYSKPIPTKPPRRPKEATFGETSRGSLTPPPLPVTTESRLTLVLKSMFNNQVHRKVPTPLPLPPPSPSSSSSSFSSFKDTHSMTPPLSTPPLSPDYENITISPDHYLQNEVEYAVVAKSK